MSELGQGTLAPTHSAGIDREPPRGWKLVPLGDLARPSTERIEPAQCPDAPYLSLEHIEAHTTRILGHGVGADVSSTKSVFHAGDVLYGKLRPYLNKVCVPSFDGICSTDILVFPRSPVVDSRVLMWFLNGREVVEHANHQSKGVQLPRVSFQALAPLLFPLPPLAEQRRIVEKVEALLARVDAAHDRLAVVPGILKRFRPGGAGGGMFGKADGRLEKRSW